MGSNVSRPLPAGIRLGGPLLGGLGLSLLVYLLWPAMGVSTRLPHPAVVTGVSFTALLGYVAVSIKPEGRPAGLANLLTLSRGTLYAVVAGFVVVPSTTALAWVPAVSYGAGVVLDKLDGTVARTIGQETAVGERLDMAVDTFGFVAAPLLAVVWGQLPVWYLSLSAARYVYKAVIGYRHHRDRPVYDPPDSELGKYLAGVQMVFLTLALAPAVPTGPVTAIAPLVLLPSLAVFTRDLLAVTGRLGPNR